ncbi:olfactory receptor 5M10-like [Trachemys scripta elegans]|uniref:olfactory receptor 5M10-like n=1 Tax=Trachemys scripta elegans TaxID=31138 RepID=UPI0015544B3E|nr:olfactory receptor 5M10-like [Trachemys scripta elegans]
MPKKNQTTVTEFILLGLSSDPQMQIFLFSVFLVIYLITLSGNIVIKVVIRAESHFNTPLYFFLFHLSFIDICYFSVTVPNTLRNFLAVQKIISVNGYIVQMFFILLSGGAEILILSTMASDRYAAICDPLRYMERMSKGICVQLLSCIVTLTSQVVLLTSVLIFGSSSFLLTLIFYIHITYTILRIRSVEDMHKAFSTCSSHLIVVVLFYPTGFLQYTKSSSVSSVMLDEMFSIQYSVLTSILNPIIYSLKNKEVKMAVGKMLRKLKFIK